MKRINLAILIFLVFFCFGYAANDIYILGSVYTEISSHPENLLRAGNRVRLYSELTREGATQIKCRVWGLNQTEDILNRFDRGFYLSLNNIIDWVEVQLQGQLFPQGPEMQLSFGTTEVDYSPYLISVKDRALSNYNYESKNYFGVTAKEIKWGNLGISGFLLAGFDSDPLKNMFGGRLTYQKGSFSLAGTYLDYGFRVQEAGNKIKNKMETNQGIESEIETENVVGLEFNGDLPLGTIHGFLASQQNNYYRRVDSEIMPFETLNMSKKVEFKVPFESNIEITAGYRDFPKGFDPILRDRTPEFHPVTGMYIGYNLIDRYQGKKGFYYVLDAKNDKIKLNTKFSNLADHLNPSHFRTVEVAFLSQVKGLEIDLYSYHSETTTLLNTNDRDKFQDNFSRIILSSKNINRSFTPGLEYRSFDSEKSRQLISLFCRYNVEDNIAMEVGVRQGIDNFKGGPYFKLAYKAPNGLEVCFNRSNSPLTKDDGRLYYDPDYRVLEPDNFAKVSISIEF